MIRSMLALAPLTLCLLLTGAAPEKEKKPDPNAVDSKILFINPVNYSLVVQTGIYSTPLIIAAGSELKSKGKEIAFSDLRVGQKVRLSTSQNSSDVVVDSLDVIDPPVIRKEPPPKPKRHKVNGTVNSYDPFGQLLSVAAQGNTYFISMSNKTTFKAKEKDKSLGINDLRPGTKVTLTLQDFGPGRKEVIDVFVD